MTASLPHLERIDVLGCPVDRVDMAQAVAYCESVVERRSFAQHMAINAAKLVAMHDDPQLRGVIDRCELITADGQAVVWASRLLGDPLPTRVAGIDLMHELFALAERRGLRVYVLGAKEEVLRAALTRLQEQYPLLVIAGSRNGYFADDQEAEVAEGIRDAQADMLFVAMSSPKKEYFLGQWRETMQVPFVMGVGGAIDVVAGVTRRAPRWMQRAGLEWLFRLLQEPRRMFRRYVVTNAKFALVLGRAMVRRGARRGAFGRRRGPSVP